MKRFRAHVNYPSASRRCSSTPNSLQNARAMLEAQYGQGNVVFLSEDYS